MEDDINFLENGRRPQFLVIGRWPQLFSNGIRTQHSWKVKTTTIFVQMKDDLNIFVNGRRPQKDNLKQLNLTQNN